MVLASLNQCRGKTNSHDGTKLQLHDCTYMMHIHVVHVSDPRDISKLNQRTFPIVTYSNLLTLPEYLHVNTLLLIIMFKLHFVFTCIYMYM